MQQYTQMLVTLLASIALFPRFDVRSVDHAIKSIGRKDDGWWEVFIRRRSASWWRMFVYFCWLLTFILTNWKRSHYMVHWLNIEMSSSSLFSSLKVGTSPLLQLIWPAEWRWRNRDDTLIYCLNWQLRRCEQRGCLYNISCISCKELRLISNLVMQ